MERKELEKLVDMKLHAQLLKVGRSIEKKTTHQLEPEIIEGIIATFDIMGASDGHLFQMTMDLMPSGHEYISQYRKKRFVVPMHPQYKIFDWLGMMYTGRCINEKPEDKIVFDIIEMMVKHYVAMKHVGGWAWSYRGHIDLDYEMRTKPKKSQNGVHCKDCCDSYDHWHNQTPEERQKSQDELVEMFGPPIDIM